MHIGILSLFLSCFANYVNFGNGLSSNAPGVIFYIAIGEDCCGEDPHPVHGVETLDGGFVLCGKSIDSEGNWDGFLLKIGPSIPEGNTFMEEDSSHTYTWSQTFGQAGKMDAANNVVSIGNSVFVAGIKESSTNGVQRVLQKYNSTTGALIWSQIFSSNNESAFESMHITETGGAILSGFVEGESGGVEGFKSYGNPVSGIANILYLSAEQLSSSEPPEQAIWEQQYNSFGSIRSVRSIDEGFVFVASNTEELYVVVHIDGAGNMIWQTELSNHGEATDIAVLSKDDEVIGMAISGHKSIDKGIDGSVTMLDMDGEILWNKNYGNPVGGINEFSGLDEGNPKWIFDECWGIQSTDQGSFILACGTGIEDCIGHGISCRQDPRNKWRGFLTEIDTEGEQIWYRTDSYYFEGEPEAAASASEYVFRTSGGNYASVVDQDFGIGLMLLDYGSQSE